MSPVFIGNPVELGRAVADQVYRRVYLAKVLTDVGFIRPVRPDRLVGAVLALRRWGNTPAAGYTIGSVIYPDEVSIIDEAGQLTFGEVNRRTDALARALLDAGVKPKQNVAVMCRNHRGFIEATVALSKLGANALYLNTAFAAPQLTDVAQSEDAHALIYDEEFAGILEAAGKGRQRFVAWRDGDASATSDPSLDELIASADDANLDPPASPGRVVILTSGTTGKPKGAARSQPSSLEPAAAILSRIPMRCRDRTLIAAPLFHSWGFAHFTLGLLLSSTYVLPRRFEPEPVLALVEKERPRVMPMVPVMLQRLLELPAKTRKRYDTSSLELVPVSGSALPGELAAKFMDAFGDILYNLYGSTEVAWASIATPQELRESPGTAGRAPFGTRLALYDEKDKPVADGQIGRIFVANNFQFEGYTGGGGKAQIDGLMSTGDMGRIDKNGLLFVEGRDDEMIVSGGENVFPAEVEDTISRLAGVVEVAVIGIPDPQYGQRLKAFVVKKSGAKITEEQVKARVKADLARFKVPRDVEFVSALPPQRDRQGGQARIEGARGWRGEGCHKTEAGR